MITQIIVLILIDAWQIVTVDKLSIIEGAQNIELAHILGWQCVIRKGDFKVGDLSIYFCIDSVLDPVMII